MYYYCQGPWEMLKTYAFTLGFKHPSHNLAKCMKTLFNPYISIYQLSSSDRPMHHVESEKSLAVSTPQFNIIPFYSFGAIND